MRDVEPRPLLQIALDHVDSDKALRLAEEVCDYTDIIEVGTMLLKKEGVRILEKIKIEFPQKLVFADTKTMDFGTLEARMIFEAGADMMSVCAVASDKTIELAIREAHAHKKKVMIDMIGTGDSYRQIKRLSFLEPDYITVHTGVDERFTANNLFEKVEIVSQISPIPLAIAGGIKLDDIPYLLIFHPAILIIGSTISMATDPRATAKQFWESLRNFSPPPEE